MGCGGTQQGLWGEGGCGGGGGGTEEQRSGLAVLERGGRALRTGVRGPGRWAAPTGPETGLQSHTGLGCLGGLR